MRISAFVLMGLLVFALTLQAYEENFEGGKADGWVVVTGTWEVEDGCYHQIDPSGVNLFSFYAAGNEAWKDYTFELKVKPIQTPYAGVVFRVMEMGPGGEAPNWSKGHFFSWLIGTGKGKGYSKVWKAMLGAEAMLEGTDGDMLGLNEWSEIKVIVEGKNIQCYLNDNLQKNFDDTQNSILTGGIGLMTYGDTMYDDVIVKGPGIPGSSVDPSDKLAATWGKIRRLIP